MSGTKTRKAPLDPQKLLENNPQVDRAQVREAQELIRELRRGGVSGPSYEIDSPYERRPMRKPES